MGRRPARVITLVGESSTTGAFPWGAYLNGDFGVARTGSRGIEDETVDLLSGSKKGPR
jgi:hypothetical protein